MVVVELKYLVSPSQHTGLVSRTEVTRANFNPRIRRALLTHTFAVRETSIILHAMLQMILALDHVPRF